MKTIKDIIDMIDMKREITRTVCNTYGHLYCDTCSKCFKWCFLDSYVLALDYLNRGKYYG